MLTTLILAAGKGTRLKSDKPKVLHEIKGKPSLYHVIDLAKKVSDEVIVIVGYQHELVEEVVRKNYPNVKFALQIPQNGTAHAVEISIPQITKDNDVVVLSGDVPNLKEESLKNMIDSFYNNKKKTSFIAAEVDDPAKYGRVILDKNNNPKEVVEFIDLKDDQIDINLINSGVYIFDYNFLVRELSSIKKNDKNGEFFLPDLIKSAAKIDKAGVSIIEDQKEILGFNTQEQLKELNNL